MTISLETVHVAVGVIVNAHGQVLISKRARHAHQGGLWEFPGGKIEKAETVQSALERELEEELGIKMQAAQPLIRIPHCYVDKKVLLDVWQVTQFEGEAHGREGQPLQWVASEELNNFTFPAANYPIINAARLPAEYMITGEFSDHNDFFTRLEQSLKRGIKLVQLRLANEKQDDVDLVTKAIEVCHKSKAMIVLNAQPHKLKHYHADGIHLNRHRLMQFNERPVPENKWLSVSVHNEDELKQAHLINADFILVSPVQKTSSHPGATPIGWDGLSKMTEKSLCPVYALGGMQASDISIARRSGAQGIAAISSLWGNG